MNDDETKPLPKKRMVKTLRKFPKEILLELLDYSPGEEHEDGQYTMIDDRFIDKSRWSLHHELIFKFEDKIYIAPYSHGATEYQDESPWQYEREEVQCYEAEARPITTYVYVPKFTTVEDSSDAASNAPASF